MRVSPISSTAAISFYSSPNDVQRQLDWVKQQVVRARVRGEDEVAMILQDEEVIRRVRTLYGIDRVQVEESPSRKVTISL